MRATTITPQLIQLTRLRAVNAYLVREDDGFTLIDTTISGAADDLIGAARAAGGEIVRVALTHGHGDHVGSLDALHERLGADVPVLMPELDARIHAGESVTDGKPKGSWPKLTTPLQRIAPGQRIGSLEVVASPGHTLGHVSFLDTRDRALIAGDSFTTIGGVAVTSHLHWRFPLAGAATQDRGQALTSGAAALELAPSVLVVGHGSAVREPDGAMRAAIERARRAAG